MRQAEFLLRWSRFVTRWAQLQKAPGKARALVDELLESGLEAVTDGLPSGGEDDRLGEELSARCAVEVIRGSDLFDARAYRRANADVRAGDLDPLVHFCEVGWRLLRNPSTAFDVWWYWSEYLDPATDEVNPLLHFLVLGRRESADPVPPRHETRPPTRYPSGATPRRVCLFAGYDPDGMIDDYVVDYLRELSRFADVYYLADGFIHAAELLKLREVTRQAWALPHGAYDFGSYATLARDLVGWDVLDGYDEVILANDSGFLVRSLEDVFDEMDQRPCDWWGLQMTRHDFERDSNGGRPLPIAQAKAEMIGERFMSELDHLHISSYFLVLRRPVVVDPGFRKRFDAVAPQSQKVLVIYKYEIGLSRYLMCRGFDFSTFIDELYPFHPLYTAQYFDLLRLGFPLLKRNFLSENSRNVPDLVNWRERVAALAPEADLDKVERNLLRVSAADSLHRSFSLVTGDDGRVDQPTPLVGRALVEEDRYAPKFDHWWAFPVSPRDHLLSGDQRAVFESVREDPSIKKIVLTRTRRVLLDGANVVVHPLRSSEGQLHLVRSGTVFVTDKPRTCVTYPISPRRHRFINVGAPSLVRHGRADLAATTEELEDASGCHAVVSSDGLARLAASAAFFPLGFEDVWPTGAPRNDLVVSPFDVLPPALQSEERELRALLDHRRLVLVVPSFEHGRGWTLTDDQARRVNRWCEQESVVLGFRDDPADTSRRLSHLMEPLASIRLGYGQFPSTVVHDRVAVAMLTDWSSRATEFMVTGRPVVSYLTGEVPDLFYDLGCVLPGPVCQDFDQLMAALDGLLDTPSAGQLEERWRRVRLLHGPVDDANTRRLLARVKAGAQPPR